MIAKYKGLQELDAPIVNELCEKILIHEAYRIDDGGRFTTRYQKIEIYYRFVGKQPTPAGEIEHEIVGSRHLCSNNNTAEKAAIA